MRKRVSELLTSPPGWVVLFPAGGGGNAVAGPAPFSPATRFGDGGLRATAGGANLASAPYITFGHKTLTARMFFLTAEGNRWPGRSRASLPSPPRGASCELARPLRRKHSRLSRV